MIQSFMLLISIFLILTENNKQQQKKKRYKIRLRKIQFKLMLFTGVNGTKTH